MLSKGKGTINLFNKNTKESSGTLSGSCTVYIGPVHCWYIHFPLPPPHLSPYQGMREKLTLRRPLQVRSGASSLNVDYVNRLLILFYCSCYDYILICTVYSKLSHIHVKHCRWLYKVILSHWNNLLCVFSLLFPTVV